MPRYRSVLRIYQQYLVHRKAAILAVDNAVLIGFLDHLRARKARDKTLKYYFSAISCFYEYLAFKKMISANPVILIRKRYLKSYKDNHDGQERKLISVEEMGRMINSEMDIRDKAIITLLAKTGIMRNELIRLDVSDVDFVQQKIRLKQTAKRTNRTVFFDDEAAFILRRWLRVREGVNRRKETALFLSTWGFRISRNDVYLLVVKAAERVGLHDPGSDRMEDHFSPHCARHWNTTYLLRAGMKREYVQWLRGDAIKEAVDIYFHVEPERSATGLPGGYSAVGDLIFVLTGFIRAPTEKALGLRDIYIYIICKPEVFHDHRRAYQTGEANGRPYPARTGCQCRC